MYFLPFPTFDYNCYRQKNVAELTRDENKSSLLLHAIFKLQNCRLQKLYAERNARCEYAVEIQKKLF